jgi:ATP-dependent DNA helicase RecQ
LTFDPAPFLAACVSIDLEVDPKSARLFAFAAVRGEAAMVHKGAALDPALDRLEAFCDGAAHLVGHNILRHDLPYLVANRARLAGLTVSTCHALAMRLMGASFAGDQEGPRDFDGIVMQAVALLRGDGLSKAEVEALRETLIQGYRWLLVDEYQDIGPEQYALIGAVAGRSLEDDLRISLFAVGDDDQNIYAFAGASIDFIRRFEADYAAKPVWLTENYRSSAHIIAAVNAMTAPAAQRMKAGHDITVNRARSKAMPGGDWAALDPVAQGRVTLLDAGGDAAQAVAALDELVRLSRLDPDWSWRRCAVIARDWRRLEPVRAYAEALGIPIDMANEKPLNLWRMREMQGFISALLADRTRLLAISDLVAILNAQPQSRWTDLIGEGIGALARELVEKAAPVPDTCSGSANGRGTCAANNGVCSS